MSESAVTVLSRIVLDRFQGPRTLYDAWTRAEVIDSELVDLIPDTWLYMDW